MTRPPRALVVEDDPSWGAVLSEILLDCGLDVDQAVNLEGALEHLRARPHRLAVVDLSLQADDPHNQDGLRVLDAVRRMDPGCAALLLTGFATVELAVSAISEHAALTVLRKETFQRGALRALAVRALTRPPSELEGDEVGAGEITRQDAAPAAGRSGPALVVEDDAGWRAILAELLEDAGYQPHLCAGYGEALGCLRRENYRLAVVDLSLTDRNGWDEPGGSEDLEGFRLLELAHQRQIPTIVVSGSSRPERIERAYQDGQVTAYLEKQSFDRRSFLNLARGLAQAAARNEPLSGLTAREREVLDLLGAGLTNREIAGRLVISENTVKRHIKAVFVKLGVHTRAAAVCKLDRP